MERQVLTRQLKPGSVAVAVELCLEAVSLSPHGIDAANSGLDGACWRGNSVLDIFSVVYICMESQFSCRVS